MSDEMGAAAIQVTSQKGNDERGTPTPLINKLKRAIGGDFDLDPCSGAEPTPIATTRFNEEDNGLALSWAGYKRVYMNPPYSNLHSWLEKAVGEYAKADGPELIVCLLPGNTSTAWFQDYAARADYLCLIKGRLKFDGTDQGAPFASILTVFGDAGDELLATMDHLGTLYERSEIADSLEVTSLEDLFESDGDDGTTAPTTPGGPAILDASRDGPIEAGGGLDLYDVRSRDVFRLQFNTDMLGAPMDLPDELDARVITGARATEKRTQTPDEYHTLLLLNDALELYICLHQDPDDARVISCTISDDGSPWQHMALETIERVSTGGGPALDPYGCGIEGPDTAVTGYQVTLTGD